MTARLRVNPIMCEAHGLCAELLPELIRRDDWGYPIIDEQEVPPELLRLARKAAGACPTLALLLDERRDQGRRGMVQALVRQGAQVAASSRAGGPGSAGAPGPGSIS